MTVYTQIDKRTRTVEQLCEKCTDYLNESNK